MTKEIPLFPLNIVAYPGELLNLHIFEPRYKQLVKDCLESDGTFGIPSYVNNKIEFGTEVEILKVEKVYEDGRMDIRTRGTEIFEIVEYHDTWNDKLYAGGVVKYLENDFDHTYEGREQMFTLASELFSWLHMSDKLRLSENSNSYTIAHKIGLNLEEEYNLLQILNESARIEFIIGHLSNLIPALERAQSAKEKIKLNGHFKHLTPPKF
jgi:Lon protease-like protein